MKLCLHLTLPELQDGETTQVGSKTRISELKSACFQRNVVAIEPLRMHNGKTISAVLPTAEGDDLTGKGTSLRIKFRPVWCKAFTLCKMKKHELSAVICEFPDRTVWIDEDGVKPATLTTKGPGCDPQVVQHAEVALGELLQESSNEVMQRVVEFIRDGGAFA